ncbi:MAG: SGNH/GDSL hydrolase family protein, partial [Candidatus Binatia bacterium]
MNRRPKSDAQERLMLRGWNVMVLFAIVLAACGGGGSNGSAKTARRGIGLEDLDGDGEVFVIAFGDSITRGVGDGARGDTVPPLATGGYPARLQRLVGVPVLNFGVPGEQTAQGRARLPKVLQATRTDYVILLEGVNDVEHRLDGDAIRNLQGMIDSVFQSGAMPIVGTLTPTCCDHRNTAPESRILRFNDTLRAMAESQSVPVIDFHTAFGPDPTIGFDPASGSIHVPEGLHPTSPGYDLMAATAAEAFEPGSAST